MRRGKLWNNSYYRRGNERLRVKNVNTVGRIYIKSSRGGQSRPVVSGSQECSQWDPKSDFLKEPRHSGERRGCSGCCNSEPRPPHLGENESLVTFRETTKYRGELKLTVVSHWLAGVDLQTDDIYPPKEGEQDGHTTME